MRVFPLAALVALLALPSAVALDALPEVGWVCIPEDPVCLPPGSLVVPGSPLCPALGMTFGWCAQVSKAPHGASLLVAAGNHYGPQAWNQASLSLVDADGDGLPDAVVHAHAEASPCPPLMMAIVLPAPLPVWPCAAKSVDLQELAQL